MASISRLVPNGDRSDAQPEISRAYIAVMGATGSGKSSLVSSITGREGIVGHGLESDALETSEVASYETTIGSTNFVLVDTPGFDDTEMSDYEILHAIAAWLEKNGRKGQRLSGLVYLHRINNTRMAGSAVRALHLFQRICGEENYKNVILATTFWNKIEHCKEEGIDRERRLFENEGFWKSMKEKGALTVRLAQDYRDILPALLEIAEKPPVTLEIQQELSDGLTLEQTMAGLFINNDSEQLMVEHEAMALQMQREFAKEVEEKQHNLNAKRGKQRQQVLKAQEDLKRTQKRQQLMNTQLELYRLNQRVKEAELRARLREEEEIQVRAREQEEMILRQQRERQDRESRQRTHLSLTQRRVVDQQLDLFRAAKAAGLVYINVGTIDAEGVGMVNDDCSDATVTRSGLNVWCDYCLKPFGQAPWYLCSVCNIDRVVSGLGLCAPCYVSGRRCCDQDHDMVLRHDYSGSAKEKSCLRFRSSHNIICDVAECRQQIEGLYFHCCKCSGDDLDICVSCVVSGGYHCHDRGHSLAWGVQPLAFAGLEC